MSNPYIIVISCVTTETVMVSSPSIFYKADEVHLFRYIRDPRSKKSKLYRDHYNEVVRKVSTSLPSCRIIEHSDEPVYEVNRMARSLDKLYCRISKDNDDFRILANLSSGPSEFAAALGYSRTSIPAWSCLRYPRGNTPCPRPRWRSSTTTTAYP
ncbi:hypothetical protein [Methanomethylophilus alvi]|uniref:hypothetical protein n=1 Tax=Methanomethylophilus alvi TaxID=1291540 RepID=UPI0037DC5F97